jgi:hypothetical protein
VNGVLNQISQDYAFRQDGGVWAWSALADYAANRVVLGSDGLLYWSVAQSGPNVGGAQDPTADTGVYWSTLSLPTPPLADDSSKAATTEWVRNLVAATIYLDGTNGNDANDGLSASDAVKTFSRALAMSVGSGTLHTIVIAGGTYAIGEQLLERQSLQLELSGNVVFTGSLRLDRGSFLIVKNGAGGSYSLTINNNDSDRSIYILNQSTINIFTDIIINTTKNTAFSVELTSSSYLYFGGSVSIAHNSTKTCFNISFASLAYINNTIAITGGAGSLMYVGGGSTLISTFGIDGSGFDGGLEVDDSSLAYFRGQFKVGSTSGFAVLLSMRSGLYIDATSSSEVDCASGGAAIGLYTDSTVYINVSSGVTLNIKSTSGTAQFGIAAENNSFVRIIGSGTITFSGAYNEVTRTAIFGKMEVGGSLTLNGSPSGYRYFITNNGQVLVYGAGINRIPGSTAGYCNPNDQSYYG